MERWCQSKRNSWLIKGLAFINPNTLIPFTAFSTKSHPPLFFLSPPLSLPPTLSPQSRRRPANGHRRRLHSRPSTAGRVFLPCVDSTASHFPRVLCFLAITSPAPATSPAGASAQPNRCRLSDHQQLQPSSLLPIEASVGRWKKP